MTGIVSLKPTAERIPTEGHLPPEVPTLHGWNTVGPMARRIADLHLALTVLSRTPVSPLEAVAIHERRVLSPRPLWFMPPAAEINMAWAQAVKALVAAGMVHDEGARVPLMRAVLAGAAGIYKRGLNVLHAEIKDMPDAHISAGMRNNLRGVELFAKALGVVGIRGTDEQIDRLRERFITAMGPGGVICYPTWPDPAPEHGYSAGLRGSPGYVNWVNVLGFPAVAVPVGHSSEGLPLSVQIVAQPGEDEVALAVAQVIEAAFGGWRPPM
jgi:Asp-tRNA(Asn)/Glu-tRNA(Gln) amidotransferase A subunit family amidase